MRPITAALLLTLANPAWAQQPRLLLPPEEFDHPYYGYLIWAPARDQAHVRELCGPKMPFGAGPAIACAIGFPNNGCLVVILPDDEIRKLGWDPDIVRRHEIGHCNAWPSSHPGARPVP
jgi:hypothetical protein